jgi:pyruvate-ferredoxin/flavodoxin oxidoreductase
MAIVAHVATLTTGIPFVHFFDGYQTSHEMMKCFVLKYSDIAKLYPRDCVKRNLRDKALTTVNPINRGSG